MGGEYLAENSFLRQMSGERLHRKSLHDEDVFLLDQEQGALEMQKTSRENHFGGKR